MPPHPSPTSAGPLRGAREPGHLPSAISAAPNNWTLTVLCQSLPQDTRMVLGLSLAAALNRPLADSRFGVFRM